MFERTCLLISRLLRGRSVFGYRYVDPLEYVFAMLDTMTALAMIGVVVKHSEQVGGLLEEIAKPLRFLIGDEGEPS